MPVRGRVVDRASGLPVSRYWIGALVADKAREHFHRLAPLDLFGSFHELLETLKGAPLFHEVISPDGVFELDYGKWRGSLLFVLAEDYAILIVACDPFWPEGADPKGPMPPPQGFLSPVIGLAPLATRVLRALDDASEAPLEGVRARVRTNLTYDYLSDGFTLGQSEIEIPLRKHTAAVSDAQGRISIPLLLEFATPSGRDQPMRTVVFYPASSFLLEKDGYGLTFWEPPDDIEASENAVHLSPAAASLEVVVVDGENRPVPAGIYLSCPGLWGDGDDLEIVTDGAGRCTIRNVPVGAVRLQAVAISVEEADRHAPGVPLPEGFTRPGEGAAWADEVMETSPGTSHPVQLQFSRVRPPDGRQAAPPVVCGSVEKNTLIENISISCSGDNRSVGSNLAPGAESYGIALPGPGTYRVTARMTHREFGALQMELGTHTLKEGERKTLDIVYPALRLFRLAGKVEPPDGPGAVLPGTVRFELEESFAEVSTPGLGIEGFRPGGDPVPFQGWLAPGRYRIKAQYAVSSGFADSLALGRMELRGDDLERRIQLPWVARVQLRPVDEETRQALEPEDCDWTLVPADRSERAEDEPLGLYFAPRGSYKVLFLCSGRLPATCAFTVVGTETLVKVEIPLRKGEAGVLSGTVVARGTRRSLRCGVRFEHRATGMGYSVQCPEGRFRLSGLMAGEYVLFVWGAGPLREFRFTIAENEKKQDLVLEKDPG